jgi:hypothetical protein
MLLCIWADRRVRKRKALECSGREGARGIARTPQWGVRRAGEGGRRGGRGWGK